MEERADQLRLKFMPEVLRVMEQGLASLSTDMWLDSYTKHNYLALSVHYLRKAWVQVNQILFCMVFPDNMSKTGENLKEFMVLESAQIGVTEERHLKKSCFLSDKGSNVVKSLEDYLWLYCMAHCLNIVLSSTFVARLKDIDLLGLVGHTFMESVLKVTQHMVERKLLHQLPHELVVGSVNLPRSLCKTYVPMLLSIEQNFAEVSHKITYVKKILLNLLN